MNFSSAALIAATRAVRSALFLLATNASVTVLIAVVAVATSSTVPEVLNFSQRVHCSGFCWVNV